jgi:hypothetical protein
MAQTYAESQGMKMPGTLEQQQALLDSDRQVIVFGRPFIVTDRMSAQQTFFTVAGSPLTDHEAALGVAIPSQLREPSFVKLIIESGIKRDCLRHLRRMNVTSQALFPGIDGLGASIGEAIRLEVYGRVDVVRRPEGGSMSLMRDASTGEVRVVPPHEVGDAQTEPR